MSAAVGWDWNQAWESDIGVDPFVSGEETEHIHIGSR